ncbi:Proteasome subunit alpha type-2 [Orbilia oligospora]|uniref:Mannose-1-phosphate guanyltransferase n=1 Tax=Orbilia oligospora TaxID=2813651 RepID=A0A7C8QWB6_ORBOL|nr:Proteasome subunit alpha type-2 [Orbilia oligospora]
MSTKALILVGGSQRGTRFRPLSLDQPKPLFDVAGHPIIWHCLTALTKIDVKEVFLIGYYDESIFRDFIRDSSKEFPQFTIKYLREYEPLGTAGGLYHFRDVILKGSPKRFFVLNADVCCSFPLKEMLQIADDREAEAVILGTRVSNEAASNFGCIVSDPTTKRVLHYVEKPESHISNLINCGVYLFGSSIIFKIRKAMEIKADRRSSDPLYDPSEEDGSENVLRLEQDILGPLAEEKSFYVYETRDFWRQIKTAGSAVPANALYLQKAHQSGAEDLAAASTSIIPPVYIHPTAIVDPTAKLGPNVSIGPRAHIGAGARVKDSIVLEDAEIKHDACVLYSIVGWNARIGAWARVEGTPISVNQHSTTVLKNGVKVQSVTILAKDCVVHDEIRVQNCVCLPYKELKKDVVNEVIM